MSQQMDEVKFPFIVCREYMKCFLDKIDVSFPKAMNL